MKARDDPHYKARWMQNRRRMFFSGKSCAICGSTTELELDHINPATKVSHYVWSWRQSRRLSELAKCQVLCCECHKKKTAEELRRLNSGKPNPSCRKLTWDQAETIRRLSLLGATNRELSSRFSVAKTTIHSIVHKTLYVQKA